MPSTATRPRRPARHTRRAHARLIGCVALVVGLGASCTSGGGHAIAPTKPRIEATTTSTSPASTPLGGKATPTTDGTAAGGRAVPSPTTMTGDIATPIAAPVVYEGASAATRRIALPKRNSAGVDTTFAVVGPSTGTWIQVLLPTRPNERMAWVPQTSVKITHTDLRVMIDLGARRLRVERAGAPVLDVQAAIGTPQNPTPTGATYVTELIQNRDPKGSYGPYAYGLALHSNTLSEFAGGDGQVGVHGTNRPDLIGARVSHGCIRLHNADVVKLLDLQLPIGVPVFIS
ncbi:MAG: hypothetical protein JWM05_2258 [Acidimicrobiales bacterium]|nr:hypothetical protein [Acidimicrobiales bacterium]